MTSTLHHGKATPCTRGQHRLSITHKLRSKDEAELDVDEAA
jgi:hypothetical protein